MREYKVTYETPARRNITIRDSSLVSAESKSEAIDMALYGDLKLISARLMPLRKNKDLPSIERHDFSDCEVSDGEINGSSIQINMVDKSRPALINKRDAIAIAKHFKLKASDLK